jgi:hypothetical protein
MKAVWLSSTYYLDEAVQGLSANAERMLTRGLAYCGNAETGGYITQGALNMLGLPNPKKLVRELVDGEILTPQADGRWYFKAWPEWNSSGDKLIARQKADRERQARRRAEQQKSREASRDSSRDVTHPEQRREEQNFRSVPEAARPSDASGVAATIGAKLLDDAGIDPALPDSPRLRSIANELVMSGSAPADVTDGLRDWNAKTGIGPAVLRSLVSDVVKRRNTHAASTNGGQPTSKMRTLATLAAEQRAAENAQLQAVAPKGITR